MHEVGITKDLVESLQERISSEKNLNQITEININLGTDLHISEESLRFWFNNFSKGTKLEKANINIKVVDGKSLDVQSIEFE